MPVERGPKTSIFKLVTRLQACDSPTTKRCLGEFVQLVYSLKVIWRANEASAPESRTILSSRFSPVSAYGKRDKLLKERTLRSLSTEDSFGASGDIEKVTDMPISLSLLASRSESTPINAKLVSSFGRCEAERIWSICRKFADELHLGKLSLSPLAGRK